VLQPWILCGTDADATRASALEAAGARVVRVELDRNGEWEYNWVTLLGYPSQPR
jgi:hypothetical protein